MAPEKTRPDNNRIFPNSFGSETPKNKAKTVAKTHHKTQNQNNHPKTKVRSRNFFQKTTLRKEERQKKGKRHRTRHAKHKMKKRTAFPPRGNKKEWQEFARPPQPPKNKVRSRKIFQKASLRKEERQKTAKDTGPDTEKTKKKKRTAFPPWGSKNEEHEFV